jgi:copper transport protein
VVWWLLRRLRVADRNERIGMGMAGAVLGAGIAATWGAAGHASTGRQVPLALPADIAHLLAMAIWLGGLAVLAVALLSRKENPQIQSAVPRFSRIAFGCVVAIVLTGLYQSWRQAGGLTALTDTTYGRVLLVKLGIFGALIGLAYVARGVLRYQFGDEGGIALLRRIVAAETAIALGVLGLTAALVNLQPARDAYAADQTASTGGSKVVRRVTGWDTGSDRGGKGTVAVSMTPARVGRNSLRVTVADAQGVPRAVGAVRMTFTEIASKVGPLKADVVPGRNTGEYFVSGVELPLPGNWRVTMFIRTTDVDEAFVTVSVPVA